MSFRSRIVIRAPAGEGLVLPFGVFCFCAHGCLLTEGAA
jgi:hypothetical protein